MSQFQDIRELPYSFPDPIEPTHKEPLRVVYVQDQGEVFRDDAGTWHLGTCVGCALAQQDMPMTTSEPLDSWVAEALIAELRHRGFDAERADAVPSEGNAVSVSLLDAEFGPVPSGGWARLGLGVWVSRDGLELTAFRSGAEGQYSSPEVAFLMNWSKVYPTALAQGLKLAVSQAADEIEKAVATQ